MFKFIFLSVNFQNYHFFTLYITYIHASSRTKLDSISRSQNGVYFVMIMNMKILFVCHGNVARSQIAEAIYNKLTNSNDAESAGTHVDKPGETLGQRKKRIGASLVVDVMNDVNMSINNKKRTQLTRDMLENFDKVINMSPKRYAPTWLAKSPKYSYWKIRDPMSRGYTTTDNTRKTIEKKVKELLVK